MAVNVGLRWVEWCVMCVVYVVYVVYVVRVLCVRWLLAQPLLNSMRSCWVFGSAPKVPQPSVDAPCEEVQR